MSLISILMPVKNAGLFLKECLDSIINQTETNWELICINDHSSDNSEVILQEYSKLNDRIKTYDNNGHGIIEALRFAYSQSNGNLIHRMDADDLMPENKLEVLKQSLLKKGKGHIATAKVKYFFSKDISDGYLKYQDWLNNLVDNNNHWDEIYQECVIASPCWLIHKVDLDQCDAFNPNTYPEDYDLVFRFFKQGLKVIAIDEVLHLWRDHHNRTSRNDKKYQEASFFTLKLNYFLELNRDNNRPLVIWGAGTKGKQMAKLLNNKNIDYTWVSNNPNKHGKEIHNQIMKSYEVIMQTNNPQIIVTVAQRNAKVEIIKFLEGLSLKEYKDFYFFR
jgi:glycosyltransferase involved in cell wall biosynthesis